MAAGLGIPHGRTATKAMDGKYSNGINRLDGVLRPDFADADDYAAIRAELTSDEARRVLDRFIAWEDQSRSVGRGRYFTRADLDELRGMCEAEGNALIYGREVAKLRDANLPVPCMITLKATADDSSKLKAVGMGIGENSTVQAWGVGGMMKHWAEEARRSRNALGLNKQARARIMEEIKQQDLFAQMEAQQEAQAEAGTADENVLRFPAVKAKLDKLVADGLVAG